MALHRHSITSFKIDLKNLFNDYAGLHFWQGSQKRKISQQLMARIDELGVVQDEMYAMMRAMKAYKQLSPNQILNMADRLNIKLEEKTLEQIALEITYEVADAPLWEQSPQRKTMAAARFAPIMSTGETLLEYQARMKQCLVCNVFESHRSRCGKKANGLPCRDCDYTYPAHMDVMHPNLKHELKVEGTT